MQKILFGYKQHIYIMCILPSASFKGNRALAEVGLGEEDSISPSALIVAAIESKFGICILRVTLRMSSYLR